MPCGLAAICEMVGAVKWRFDQLDERSGKIGRECRRAALIGDYAELLSRLGRPKNRVRKAGSVNPEQPGGAHDPVFAPDGAHAHLARELRPPVLTERIRS